MSETFFFPSFKQLFPVEKRLSKLAREFIRYHFRTFIYRNECQQLTDYLNQHPIWAKLFNQNLYLPNTLLSIYCDKRFDAKHRLTTITENLSVIEAKFGKELINTLLANGTIKLFDFNQDYSLNLNVNNIDPYEGFFSVSIQYNPTQQMVYTASFTFLKENELLIASIQGPRGEDAQALVRNATKDLHGIRPMFLLMNGFKILAQLFNAKLLGIPHKFQAKYRFNDSTKLLFNYDEFWQENNGQLNGKYWLIPNQIERKPLEEIASKKRSMYRKRYEMFDQMEQNIPKVFE